MWRGGKLGVGGLGVVREESASTTGYGLRVAGAGTIGGEGGRVCVPRRVRSAETGRTTPGVVTIDLSHQLARDFGFVPP